MTLNNDLCDFCGAYVDTMGDDLAVSRPVDGVWLLWCSVDHLQSWVAAREGNTNG